VNIEFRSPRGSLCCFEEQASKRIAYAAVSSDLRDGENPRGPCNGLSFDWPVIASLDDESGSSGNHGDDHRSLPRAAD
jgi:hypothetical protein